MIRKFELGRQAANTKLGAKRIHEVRVRGGNRKFRALRLDTGNFSWGSESIAKKTRIVAVVYNASNNELVRTNTLVKGAVIQVDATPFRQWYESHYAQNLGRKKVKAGEETAEVEVKRSNHVQRKIDARKQEAKIDQHLADQFSTGRLYAIISSRPGQSGRCDGYILEGQELDFYIRKLKARKVTFRKLQQNTYPLSWGCSYSLQLSQRFFKQQVLKGSMLTAGFMI
ncbi:ribosomal protein S8A [Basidiobolus ranarum]|uniref:40S ribosomal protein S8 n=1 Tax=Basidiobolus ranarum TaxID=34480 RepID=A0ABR2WGI9_9FUNG